MKGRSWIGCAAVAVTMGTGAASASAATFNTYVPISGAVTSCAGEQVFVNGTLHVKSTGSVSLDGTKSHIEMNTTGLKGTTLTGVRYTMTQQTSDMQHADFDPFGNVQLTLEQTEILTRQGETGLPMIGDDLRVHVLMHLTINSNGVPTSQRNDIRADCR